MDIVFTDRYRILNNIFEERSYFKVVCGAGNEDVEEVRKLAIIYTLAGATALDISANVDVVKSASEGIQTAIEMAPYLKKEIRHKPFLNVSIGLKGDPHVRKAIIDLDTCTLCGECRHSCKEREAISEGYIVDKIRCIGCGECRKVCKYGAISFYNKKVDYENILPECIKANTETMELHAVSNDDQQVMNDWKLLNKLIPDNFISMCVDRHFLSNEQLINRIMEAYEITGERMIVQADGDPMSGDGDTFNVTLQAIACADIVAKSGIPVKILLSGGTNSKTGTLAKQCGVQAHGVAIGSYARNVVKKYLVQRDLEYNRNLLKEAVGVAESLIKVNIEAINGSC